MKPFDRLTTRGITLRLRRLAEKALEQYDLEVKQLKLVGIFTNTLFRVRVADGKSYLLRVCTDGWRTETDLRSEVIWLRALSQEVEIGAPALYPAREGSYIVEACAEGVPGPRRCLVMSWIPGVLLGRRLTEENLFKMGVLFARLHEQALKFAVYPEDKVEEERGQGEGVMNLLREGFTTLKMDKILSRGEEDVLFQDACLEELPSHSWEVLLQVKARVEEELRRLYADPAGLRVIHDDLWHDNIKIYRGKLHPLDFEDTVWGYPVQDLAMALQDLMMDVKPEKFEPLQAALRRGYESRLPWPESYPNQIDVFRAGRLLWVTNYVARFQRKHLGEHVEWLTVQLDNYLKIGKLRIMPLKEG